MSTARGTTKQSSSPEEVAVAVSVAGTGGLDGLSRVTRTISLLELARMTLIENLRESGASWEEIGRACGMTRQGAQRRWSQQIRGASFGAAAAAYERSRPTYPPAAVEWMLPEGVRRVLDVGAGTGKLTRQLLGRGLEVTALEPSREMRTEFSRAVPGVPIVEGFSEDLPFDDDSFDVVTFGQAWHWMDSSLALPEVERVLRPGGWFTAIWNLRDQRESWVAELDAITQRGAHRPPNTLPKFGPDFGPPDRLEVEWTDVLTPSQVVDVVASRTYVITLAESERADVISKVRTLIDTHPALRGLSKIPVPYVTHAARAQLRAS
ncbi:MAG TPA: class I SAM-dependent methyltransferase [Galbitalea sp.]|nr:class I SAM-dependent methyltransferase [Galbitalea sp.]